MKNWFVNLWLIDWMLECWEAEDQKAVFIGPLLVLMAFLLFTI